jgi:dATP/dGTP diphosphohydrolase, N-terminal
MLAKLYVGPLDSEGVNVENGSSSNWEQRGTAIYEPEELVRIRAANRRKAGEFVTKDSGHCSEYASGMVRDTQDGKPRFNLLFPLGVPYEAQMITRLAALLERGMNKYGWRNWENANSDEELIRFKESAHRHFIQWLTGETDEDHAAAAMFNILAAEFVTYKQLGG